MTTTSIKIITTDQVRGPLVTRFRKLAKLYAREGRGSLTVKEGEGGKVFICVGDLIEGERRSRSEAAAVLRSGGFCEVSRGEWRPRYSGAPWMKEAAQ